MDSPSMPSHTPPASASPLGTRRRTFFLPLSNHGMPKLSRPSSTLSMTPMSPRSPTMSPMSPPPMSAKSFGTFIDSEPSTPAYSPRDESSKWDNSTIMLLSPVSSAPSSPPEPEWEMLAPGRTPKRAPHPIEPIEEEVQKENLPPTLKESPTDPEAESKPEEEPTVDTAPRGKLARMKSLLRRKTQSVSEKKPEKRRRKYQDLDRIEDVHWTEM